MDPARRKLIASLGGKSVSPQKRSFFLDRQLAKESGRKGGRSVPPGKRAFSSNSKLAQQAGRKGGMA